MCVPVAIAAVGVKNAAPPSLAAFLDTLEKAKEVVGVVLSHERSDVLRETDICLVEGPASHVLVNPELQGDLKVPTLARNLDELAPRHGLEVGRRHPLC